jgi:hypothetical protein
VKVAATSDDGQIHRLEPSPLWFQGSLGSTGFGEGRLSEPLSDRVAPGHPQLYIRRFRRILLPHDRLTLWVGIFGMERLDGGTDSPRIAVVQVDVPESGPPAIACYVPPPWSP